MESCFNARSLTIGALLAAAALTAVPQAHAQSIVQGPIRNPANGNVYFRLSSTNWTDAQNFATSQLAANLVTINDAAENSFVLNNFANAPGSGRVWLGLNDATIEGIFQWSSGQPPTFFNWDAGEPNNGGGIEDWVLMYSGNGRWNDVPNVANPPAIGPVYGVVEVPCTMSVVSSAINFQNGSTYQLLSSASWSCSELYASNVLGLHLATINDAAENEFIRATFAAGAGRVWIGLNDFAADGTYVWSDGGTSAYSNWSAGEPSNGNGGLEDFIMMYGNNGTWNDARDLQNPPALGPISGVVESACEAISVEAGPVVNPANGHTYYRLSFSNWSCAEARARTLGGHLASINDAAENEFIRSTFVTGSIAAAFGLNDYTTEGTFTNINGDAVSYTNWNAGEPNNSGDEDFAVMYNTGGWNDVPNIGGVYGIVEVPSTINDTCANALDVVSGGTYFGTLAVATNDGTATCGSSATNPDVWYRYTNTSTCLSAALTVTTCGTHDAAGVDTGMDTVLSLRSGCSGTELACNDDTSTCSNDTSARRDSSVSTTVAPGASVLIRVSKFSSNPRLGPFRLNVAASLIGEECSNPVAVGAGVHPYCNTGTATNGPAACGGLGSDVWFRFVQGPAGGVVEYKTCGSAYDTVIAVYPDACPATASLACNDDNSGQCGGFLDSYVRLWANAGQAYLVRVGGFVGRQGNGTLTINPLCAADVDDGQGVGIPDGGVTIDDLLYYLQIFEAGSLSADVDDGSSTGTQDGGVTIDDLLYFLFRFENGC